MRNIATLFVYALVSLLIIGCSAASAHGIRPPQILLGSRFIETKALARDLHFFTTDHFAPLSTSNIVISNIRNGTDTKLDAVILRHIFDHTPFIEREKIGFERTFLFGESSFGLRSPIISERTVDALLVRDQGLLHQSTVQVILGRIANGTNTRADNVILRHIEDQQLLIFVRPSIIVPDTP